MGELVGIGTLVKLAKSQIDEDTIAEMCEAFGMALEFKEIESGQVPFLFQKVFDSASLPGSKVVRLECRELKTGKKMVGLMVSTGQ